MLLKFLVCKMRKGAFVRITWDNAYENVSWNIKCCMKVADILFLPTRQINIKGRTMAYHWDFKVGRVHPRMGVGDLLGQANTRMPLYIISYPSFYFWVHITVEYLYCCLYLYSYIYINDSYARNLKKLIVGPKQFGDH